MGIEDNKEEEKLAFLLDHQNSDLENPKPRTKVQGWSNHNAFYYCLSGKIETSEV
ncbi:hypothetical protein SOVF_203660 [Spinacia oleracea]|nr:hypothetical protein SOVF_203660 [Spinacia oleracea]